ncbi:MAG: TonB-dependent receptor [Kangiellaceae bacterium]|nr:TonB-dependent receptor [Kangiellaceae bacterium]
MPFKLLTLSLVLVANSFDCLAASESVNTSEKNEQKLIITANKLEKNLNEITSNASTIGSKKISTKNHIHINELMSEVPATWISRGNGQESLIAIRSPVLTGAGGCGAFMISVDGLSVRPAGFCNVNQLFEINSEQASSVEVIRGPSSSSFGSNAVHGLINFTTPNPMNSVDSYLLFESGPNQYDRLKFAFGSDKEQSSPDQGWLLYGNTSYDDGYQKDATTEQHKLNFIHQIETNKLKIKTLLSTSSLHQNSAGFITGEDAYADEELRIQNLNPDGFRHAKASRAYSRIEFELSENSFIEITPFARFSEMSFSQHWVPWDSIENNSQSSFGAQLKYQQQEKDYLVAFGLDSEHSESQLEEIQFTEFSGSKPAGTHYNFEVNHYNFSPWIAADLALTKNSVLSASLRFDHSKVDYDNLESDGSACDISVTDCRFYRTKDVKLSYNDWSPSLGFTNQWTQDHFLYTQLSRGFRAPQHTEMFRLQAGQQTADLNTVRVDSIEFGFRGNTNILEYDLTFYKMKKSNFIFQDSDRQNVNNGRSDHRGIEIAAKVNFNEFVYSEFFASRASHEYANNIAISSLQISGNEIDTAPKNMGQLSFGWQPKKSFNARISWQHLGKYFLNPDNTASYPGHSLVHLSSVFKLNKSIDFSLNVRNLMDRDYAERADFGFGSYRYFVGLPRSIYLGVKINL